MLTTPQRSIKLMFLAGNLHSGKDTFAALLEASIGSHAVVKIGMSDPIINLASYLYRVKGEGVWSDQYERTIPREELEGRTTRDVLRDVGDALRSQDPYVWIQCVVRSILQVAKSNPSVSLILVPGTRLIREAAVAKLMGARLVGIRRKQAPTNDLDTPTEREVGYLLDHLCHSVVNNDGSKYDLEQASLRELSYCPVLTLHDLQSLTEFTPSLPALVSMVDTHTERYAASFPTSVQRNSLV